MSLITIDDTNYQQYAVDAVIGGHKRMRGLEPRDYSAFPVGYSAFAKAFDLPLIPRDQWKERLAEQKAHSADLYNIRLKGNNGQPIPSRDQDGYGYCWAHSSVSACLLLRARDNQPYADLSAFSVAAPIKNFRNQGGWGSQSLEYIATKGVATSATWPQQSMNRGNLNDAMYADAAKYKVTEWMDLDPEKMKDQLVTCLLLGIPVVSDFNWWGHSVCTCRLVNVFDDWSIETTIWNSWGDSWSDRGMGNLKGSKAIPNGAIAPRVMLAA